MSADFDKAKKLLREITEGLGEIRVLLNEFRSVSEKREKLEKTRKKRAFYIQ